MSVSQHYQITKLHTDWITELSLSEYCEGSLFPINETKQFTNSSMMIYQQVVQGELSYMYIHWGDNVSI